MTRGGSPVFARLFGPNAHQLLPVAVSDPEPSALTIVIVSPLASATKVREAFASLVNLSTSLPLTSITLAPFARVKTSWYSLFATTAIVMSDLQNAPPGNVTQPFGLP